MSGAGDRPHVLHLGPDVPGGMITAVRGLLASPLAERYRLEFVPTHRGTGTLLRARVFLQALVRLSVWSLRGTGKIVHVHATKWGSMYRKAAVVLLAVVLRRRVVLHVHSGPGDLSAFAAGIGPTKRALLRLSLSRADAVIAVSAASAAELEAAFGLPGIEVVPNAAPPVGAVRAGTPTVPPTAVFLGGFANPVKGGELLLEAIRLLPQGLLRLLLAGPGELPDAGRQLLDSRPDAEWRGWLEAEAREEALATASVFVLASTSEGLPMALLEAMASGKAIVATAVGGVPDVVEDDAEALLVPPGEPAALAAALERLARDPELRQRLGLAARGRAAEMGPDRVAEKLDALYRGLLA